MLFANRHTIRENAFDIPLLPKMKFWVGAAIGAGVSVAGSIVGAAGSAANARKAQQQLEKQKAQNDAWYKRRYNESYLDTEAGQHTVRQARELLDRSTRQSRGSAAVGGGTDAGVAVSKESANNTVANTMSGIAAQDTQRKVAVDNQHRIDENNYTNQQMGIANQRAANVAQAASGLSNAAMTAGALYDTAGTSTKDSVVGK